MFGVLQLTRALGVTTSMTSRSLFVAVALFSILAAGYVAAYLTVLQPYQSQLRDVHAIGLSVLAAALRSAFDCLGPVSLDQLRIPDESGHPFRRKPATLS